MLYKVYIKCFMCFMDLSTFSFLQSTWLKWLRLCWSSQVCFFILHQNNPGNPQPSWNPDKETWQLSHHLNTYCDGGRDTPFLLGTSEKPSFTYVNCGHEDKNQHSVRPAVQPDICLSVLNKSGLTLLWLHSLSQCFMHHHLLHSDSPRPGVPTSVSKSKQSREMQL